MAGTASRKDSRAKTISDGKQCGHHDFHAQCHFIRLEDIGKFMLEIRIRCTECETPFQFVGLPAGLNLSGATVSVDGLEGNFAIAPAGTVPCFLDEVGQALGSQH